MYSQQKQDDPVATGGHDLPGGKFMSLNAILQELAADTSSLQSVPGGRKENMFFIIDNSAPRTWAEE